MTEQTDSDRSPPDEPEPSAPAEAGASDGDTARETRQRHPTVGAALSLVCPGLGFAYVGRLGEGLAANSAVVLALVAFAGAIALWEFFILPPLLVLLVASAALAAWSALRVRRIAAALGDDYELQPYNHWTVYVAAVLLTYVLPIAAVVVFTRTFLVSFHPVRTEASRPTLRRGDVVAVRRRAYGNRGPARGELVAARLSRTAPTRFLRAVALPGERIRMRANLLYVNGRHVSHRALRTSMVRYGSLDRTELDYFVELNRGARYPIAVDPDRADAVGMGEVQVKEGEWFLLADNRTARRGDNAGIPARDSRDVGPVERSTLVGKPTHVVWSVGPETGSIRWSRIG
ncbi:MAG: signal peptidase I, partial [Bradymonadaceae bacterium]